MWSFKVKAAAGLVLAAAMMITSTVKAGSAASYIDEEYIGYCEEIGKEYGICPYLLVALIERESSGDPTAKNGSCKGLCQVSEKWHKSRMEKLGVTDIYDPYGNIQLCADYILELAEEYEDVALVLMVYSGKSNAVEIAERGEMTSYASGILARSEELERYYLGDNY